MRCCWSWAAARGERSQAALPAWAARLVPAAACAAGQDHGFHTRPHLQQKRSWSLSLGCRQWEAKLLWVTVQWQAARRWQFGGGGSTGGAVRLANPCRTWPLEGWRHRGYESNACGVQGCLAAWQKAWLQLQLSRLSSCCSRGQISVIGGCKRQLRQLHCMLAVHSWLGSAQALPPNPVGKRPAVTSWHCRGLR